MKVPGVEAPTRTGVHVPLVIPLATPRPPRARDKTPDEMLAAFVVSVEQDAAAFERFAQAGCTDGKIETS